MAKEPALATYPARTIREAIPACDPFEELRPDDPRHVNIEYGINRGDAARLIKRIESGRPHHCHLVTGLKGAGKSTFLREIEAGLVKQRYLVAFLAADQEMDVGDVGVVEILLGIAASVAKAASAAGVPVDRAVAERVRTWLTTTVVESEWRSGEEREITVGATTEGFVAALSGLIARIQGRAKLARESRKLVRENLEPKLSDLLAYVDDLLDNVNVHLEKLHRRPLVVVIDGLDKMHAGDDDAATQRAHEALFVGRAETLRAPRCHKVYAVPSSLPYRANVQNLYPSITQVPAIPAVQRTGTPDPDGRAVLRRMVEKRLDIGALFAVRGDVDTLIDVSGGRPRDLMHLLVEALLRGDDHSRVTTEDVRAAVQERMGVVSGPVKETDYPTLIKVHATKENPRDDRAMWLMERSILVEYPNDETWCDVHPLVRRTHAFRRRWDEARGPARGAG